jgi:hypothetical protein
MPTLCTKYIQVSSDIATLVDENTNWLPLLLLNILWISLEILEMLSKTM